MSEVMRVIKVDVPMVSDSVKENFCMCSIKAKRNLTANPTEAFAEKYCAISEHVKPTNPKTAIKPHILYTCCLSPLAIPTFITEGV
jgi:hypothetical protein